MPLKFQKLDRRDFSESECFSSPHSLKYNCFTLLWDGWRYQNGWVFGKSSKGGRGVIYNPKNYIEDLCTAIFRKKMQNKFPKVRGEQRPFGFSSVLVPTPVPYLQIINQEDLFRQGGFSTIPPDFQYQNTWWGLDAGSSRNRCFKFISTSDAA